MHAARRKNSLFNDATVASGRRVIKNREREGEQNPVSASGRKAVVAKPSPELRVAELEALGYAEQIVFMNLESGRSSQHLARP